MDIGVALIIIILGIVMILPVIYSYYEPSIDIIRDVDFNTIVILWYNKYKANGEVNREHKILYDTGRNKKRYFRSKK